MINEVITKFSFLGSLKPQESFNKNLGGSIKLLGVMTAGIQAAAAGSFWWASSVISATQPLVDLRKEIGVAVGSMQELGFAASKNGSDLNAVTGSLKALNDKVKEFERFGTGSAAEAAAYLGISFRDAAGNIKGADVILEDLRKNMQGLSDAERLSIMDKMGIDSSLLRTMKLTNNEMASLRSRAQSLGVTTDEQAEAINEYSDSLKTAKFAMSGLQQMVAVGFAPMMADLVESFVEVLEVNRDWIVNGLTWLGEVISSTAGFIHRMWPVLTGLSVGFAIAKIAALGFGKALAIVFSPVVLITAAIVAVLLVIDDLMVAMQGGQSVIADFFQEFFGIDIVPVIQGIIDAVVSIYNKIVEVFEPLGDYLQSVFAFWGSMFSGEWDDALGHLIDGFKSIAEIGSNLFGTFFDAIKSMWGNVVSSLREAAMNILPDWAVKLLGGVAQGVKFAGNIVGTGAELVGDVASSVTNFFTTDESTSSDIDNNYNATGGYDRNAIMDRVTGDTTSNNNVEQIVEMNISTSDPVRAGHAAADSLAEQMRDAQMMASRGGR